MVALPRQGPTKITFSTAVKITGPNKGQRPAQRILGPSIAYQIDVNPADVVDYLVGTFQVDFVQ